MIIDKLENVVLYKEVPNEIKDFILKLNADINCGRHDLSDINYANVEMYNTKNIKDAKFESHDKFIDIQILLSGIERIYITRREGLSVFEEYNKQKDITFYSDNVENYDYVTLDSSNFVMIFPHEAHAPQVGVNGSSEVKKVVVKLMN